MSRTGLELPGKENTHNAKRRGVESKAAGPMLRVWKMLFGWWIDNWVVLTQQLIATQLTEYSHDKSIKVTKLFLILFPIFICAMGAVCYPFFADLEEDEADDEEEYESLGSDDEKDDVKEDEMEDLEKNIAGIKRKKVATPSALSKKQQHTRGVATPTAETQNKHLPHTPSSAHHGVAKSAAHGGKNTGSTPAGRRSRGKLNMK